MCVKTLTFSLVLLYELCNPPNIYKSEHWVTPPPPIRMQTPHHTHTHTHTHNTLHTHIQRNYRFNVESPTDLQFLASMRCVFYAHRTDQNNVAQLHPTCTLLFFTCWLSSPDHLTSCASTTSCKAYEKIAFDEDTWIMSDVIITTNHAFLTA